MNSSKAESSTNLRALELMDELLLEIMRPPVEMSVAEWAKENVVVPATQSQSPGRFSLAGREYCVECLDDIRDPYITDSVFCFGSQVGKTTIFMVQLQWLFSEAPNNVIWVMPNIHLAESFSETRWIPMLRASPALAKHIPTKRTYAGFSKSQQRIGGSLLNFIGSNSPANLASRPARVVIMDETDKFDRGGSTEADAVNLAEQRTKTYANPKRFKSSTPTLTEGIIWQEFLKGDQRRYFMPCPNCQKHVILAWGPDFTILDRLGCEAYVRWDKEAKLSPGKWDFARVESSAHFECPHCGGKIREPDKTWMLRNGEWRGTAKAGSHFVSRHLSSLYAVGPQTSVGKLAVQFLEQKYSLMGLQGFINGVLAEPWEAQDTRGARNELVVRGTAAGEPVSDRAVRILSADLQGVSPYFWAVAREWSPEGHSRLRWQGNLDSWDELRELQIKLGVADNHVGIDSGFQASEVYANCLRYGRAVGAIAGAVWVGWIPMKGREREVMWRDAKTKQPLPYILGAAPLPPRSVRLSLLEFNGDLLLDVLRRLRRGPEKAAGFRWELTEGVDDEYYRQLDAKVYKPLPAGRTGRIEWRWCKRSERWPDHLLDCEIMQLALATFHNLFPWGSVLPEKRVDLVA